MNLRRTVGDAEEHHLVLRFPEDHDKAEVHFLRVRDGLLQAPGDDVPGGGMPPRRAGRGPPSGPAACRRRPGRSGRRCCGAATWSSCWSRAKRRLSRLKAKPVAGAGKAVAGRQVVVAAAGADRPSHTAQESLEGHPRVVVEPAQLPEVEGDVFLHPVDLEDLQDLSQVVQRPPGARVGDGLLGPLQHLPAAEEAGQGEDLLPGAVGQGRFGQQGLQLRSCPCGRWPAGLAGRVPRTGAGRP